MTKRFLFFLAMMVFLVSPVVKGQEDADQAVRRELPGADDGSTITVIELTATATVNTGERVSATLYRQEDKGNRLVAEDMNVQMCPAGTNGFCPDHT